MPHIFRNIINIEIFETTLIFFHVICVCYLFRLLFPTFFHVYSKFINISDET